MQDKQKYTYSNKKLFVEKNVSREHALCCLLGCQLKLTVIHDTVQYCI